MQTVTFDHSMMVILGAVEFAESHGGGANGILPDGSRRPPARYCRNAARRTSSGDRLHAPVLRTGAAADTQLQDKYRHGWCPSKHYRATHCRAAGAAGGREAWPGR